MPTHRVKRQDLILSLFVLFSSEYDKQPFESIMDLSLPISLVKKYLEDRFQVSYSGNTWILTQIKNYEEEIGYKLFEKTASETDAYNLRLYHSMLAFTQKRHLYITQKIKVSNALYDMIKHLAVTKAPLMQNSPAIKLLIDAGSTVCHLADIIADQSSQSDIRYTIYTHNISVIQRFLEPHVEQRHIQIHTPRGVVDPITNSILGENTELYSSSSYDMVIQGTSFLYDGKVWVEQEEESHIKEEILKKTTGMKVLILTGHEVRTEIPPDPKYSFGHLKDFDTLIIPHNTEGQIKNLNKMLQDHKEFLEPEIMNWNYRIYRIHKT